MLLLSAVSVDAAVKTWDAGAATDNWADGNNWNPNGTPSTGDSLVFPSSVTANRHLNNNHSVTSYVSINFTGTNASRPYYLGGNAITLTGTGINSPKTGSGTDSIALNISGTGGISKTGIGTNTLFLSGANTFTGAISVTLGILKAGVASVANTSGAFGLNTAVTTANAASTGLDITGFNTQIGSITGGGTTGGGVTLGAATLTVGGSNNLTSSYAGVISGTGGIAKGGTGTLTLTASNTYTGATTINAGTLAAGVASNAAGTTGPFGNGSAVTLADVSTAVLQITGFNVKIGSLAGGGSTGGNVTLGSAILTPGGDNTSTTYAGVISGAGSVTKYGTGTWTVSGNNTYTGPTKDSVGVIKLGGAGSGANTPLGTSAGRTTILSGAAVDLNGFTLTAAESLFVNGTGVSLGGAITNSSATNAALTGLVTLQAASSIASDNGGVTLKTGGVTGAFVLTLGGTSATDSITSVISSITGLIKRSSGTWTLSGNNTFTTPVTDSVGVIKLGGAGSGANTPLGTAAARTTIISGAALDLNGFTLTAAESLFVNGTGISLGGSITNSSATNAALTGIVTLQSASSIASDFGGVTLKTGGVTGAFPLTLGGTSATDSITSVISSITGLIKRSSGTWTLSGNNTFTSAITDSVGVLKLGAAGSGGNTPLGTNAGRTTIVSGGALDLNGFTLTAAESLFVNGTGVSGEGAVTNGSATNAALTGLVTLQSNAEIASNAGGVTLKTGGVSGPFVLTLGGTSATDSVQSVIGASSVTKIESGSWVLSGANTFSGLNVREGTALGITSTQAFGNGGNITLGHTSGSAAAALRVGSAMTIARPILLASNGALTIGNNGSVAAVFSGGVTGPNNLTINNAAGTGSVSFTGSAVDNGGTVTHTGAGTGFTVISGGVGSSVTLLEQASNTASLTIGTAALTVNGSGTTVKKTGDDSLTISGGVTGSGNLTLMAETFSGFPFSVTGSAVNNIGTITNASGNILTIDISAPVGENVTQIISGSTSGSAFNVSGPVTTTGSKTLTTLNGASTLTISGGITGNGNVVLDNQDDDAGGVTVSGSDLNNTGTVTNSGGGDGSAVISAGVGSSVTQIIENSPTSALTVSGPVAVGGAHKVFTNSNASGTKLLTVSGAVTGSGNVTLQNNSAIVSGITVSGTDLNNAGTVTNSGSGSGDVLVSAIIGTNVTGVTQNSSFSQLTLSGVNTFSSGLTIRAGAVRANTSGNALGANANPVTLGHSSGSDNASLRVGTTGLVFAQPITLGATTGIKLIGNTGTAISGTFSGGVTGSGNLTVESNATNGTITFSGSGVNNAGAVFNTSVGGATGVTTISGPVGSSVTSLRQQSATAPFTVSGLVNMSANDTLENSGGANLGFSGGVTGAGNLYISNSSDTPIGLTGATAVNPTGTISYNGTNGGASISAPVGPNVSSVIQNGTTTFMLSGLLTVRNTTGTTLTTSNAGGLIVTGGVAGSGPLTLNNGVSGATMILSGATAVNPAGLISNTGAAAADVTISAPIGANVTGVVQNGTSGLILTGTNLHTTPTTITSGTLHASSTDALGAGGTGNTLVFNGGTLQASGTVSSPSTRKVTLTSTGFINTNGQSITIAGPVSGAGGLTKSGSGTLTLSGADTIGGTFTISAGTVVAPASNPFIVKGNWSNGGTFTHNGGTVTFNGSSAQTINGANATTFSGLTVDNSADVNISTSPTVIGTLTFANGKLFTGGNRVILGTSATTSGANANRFVNGYLEKLFPDASNPGFTFPVGQGSSYRPVGIAFTGTTSGSGSLTAVTSLADTTGEGSSGIDTANDVTGLWTVTNDDIGGFSTYDATLEWPTDDLPGGATPLDYVIRKRDGGVWTYPVTDSKTTNSARATGLTEFSSFKSGNVKKPGAPTGVSGTRGNGSVSLTWTAPSDTGGASISSYTATSSPGGFTCVANTGSPVTPACTVSGLTNGTGYTFTVVATNEGGGGPASSASSSVTPATTPGAPTAVNATATDAQAAVSWTAPASTGGDSITNYTVTSSLGGLTCTATPPTVACNVTGLSNNTAYTFTVTADNTVGTGSASSASNSVTPLQAPGTLNYGSNTPTYGRNVTIGTNSPSIGGGTVNLSYSLHAGTLPPGLTLNVDGTITGKPTTAGVFTPTIRVANTGGIADRAMTITVNGFTYGTASASYGQNAAIGTNSPGSITGSGGGYSANPLLPAGLTLNGTSGNITGTPTALQASTKYAITRNFDDASAVDTVAIAVYMTPPTSLSYALNTATYGKNVVISANTATVGGGTASIAYTLNSGVLPDGLALNGSTGAITGKPTTAGVFAPAIRVANDSGSVIDTLAITVNGFTYGTATATYGKNIAISSNTVSGVTGANGSYSVNPALPSGLSLNSSTGAITGTPTAQTATAKYAVTGAFDGASAIDTVAVTVNGFTYNHPYAHYAQHSQIPANTPVSVVGSGGVYSIVPSLPAGLSLDSSSGVVTGVPTTVQSDTKYTVTRTFSGASATDTITFHVHLSGPTSFTYVDTVPTYGKNVTVTPDVPVVTGGDGEFVFTVHSGALPAGLSLHEASGIISGKPTESGVFTPTIRVTNAAGSADRGLVITVNGFSYGSATVTYGKNIPITPDTVGGVTGVNGTYSVSPSLPAGLSLNASTGAITGKAVVSHAQAKHAVTRNFDGASAVDTVTITVNGFTYGTASAVYPQLASISANNPASVVGASGNYSVSPSLPAGLSLDGASGAITGTPTVPSSAAKYAVTRDFSGASATDTVTIAVTLTGPISLSYSAESPTYGKNVTITPNTATVGGSNTGISFSVEEALPTGLALNSSTGTISGKPTVAGSFSPVIRVANDSGFVLDTLAITVNGFTYGTITATYGKNIAISSNTVSDVTGANGSYSVSPALPSGLSLNTSTGAITGKPTGQTATAKYAVTGAFDGASGIDTVTITVNGFTYGTASAVYAQLTAISANNPTSVIGASGNYSVNPSLPVGLSLDGTSGAITGTPTVPSSAAKYVVTRDFSGASATDTVTIAVTLTGPTSLSYLAESPTYGKNVTITPNTATVGGSNTGISFSLEEGTFPTGVSLNGSTGTISGKPTVSGTFEPVIRVANDSGFVLDTLAITVNGFTYGTATATYGKNIAISSNTVTGVTGVNGTYSVSPSLPTGLSLNASTGAITGKPTAQTATAKYAVTGAFDDASAIDTVTITVNGFTYGTASAIYPQLASISSNTPASVVGASGNYSVSPSLPAGLSLDGTSGAITGTPTVPSSAAKYAVTRDFSGASATDTVTIAVTLTGPTSLSYLAESPSYGKNVTITPNTATVGGSNTGLSFSLEEGAFPAGISLNGSTGTISGKPTVAGSFAPVIRVANDSGFVLDTLAITVNGFTYGNATTTYGKNIAISSNTVSSVTGANGSYSVSPALPTGLSLNASTGAITGKPTAQTATAKYAVTGAFDDASGIDTVTITVNGFTYGTASAVYAQLTAISANNPTSVIGASGNYSVNPSLPSGLSIDGTSGAITGTPTVPSSATKYAVTRDFSGASATDTVTIAVTLTGPTSLSYLAESPTYGKNVTITPNTATVGGSNTGLSFTLEDGAFPTGLSLNASSGTISGKPMVVGTFSPVIRVANDSGFVLDTLAITVNGFTYGTATATYGKNIAISANTVSGVTGANGSYSVSPSLPAGLSLSASTGAITGKPTAQTTTAKYAVTGAFDDASGIDTVTITVNGFTYGTASAIYPQLASISANNPASVIGTLGTYSVSPSLPTGLSIDGTSGAITGTPTVPSSATKYAVTRDFSGASATDTVTIAVVLAGPTSLSYLAESPTYGKNVTITPNTATVGGSNTGLSFSLEEGTFPTGVSLNGSTGTISGKPTVSGVFAPVIRVANDSGFVLDTLNITVNGFTYGTATATYGKNIAISSNTVSGVTGANGSYSVSPALPSGLSLNASTGAITGKPTAQTATAKYAVTGAFDDASGIDTVTITVNGFTYGTASATYPQLAPISANNPASVIGTLGSYTVNPSLPAGLSIDGTSGAITGTPTVPSSATKYAVTRDFSGASATDTVTIAVTLTGPTSLSYSAESPTYGKNVTIIPNTATVGGSNTGLSFSLEEGAFPAGLSLNGSTGTISGKPTVSGIFEPVIRMANDSGFVLDTLNITVNGFTYGTATATYGKNIAISSNTVAGVTGANGSYSVSPALPSGLSLNASTGAITGKPTAQTATAKYAVTGAFDDASGIDTVTITVNGFTYGVVAASYGQNSEITANNPASIVGAGGTYSISPSLPAGLSLHTGTGEISGTPTAPQAVTAYAVTRDFDDASAIDSITIAVTLGGPGSLHYALDTAVYGKNIAIAVNTAMVGGSNTGVSFVVESGSLPAGLSLDENSGAISGKPTAAGVFTPTIRVSNDSGFADRTLHLTVNGFSYASATAVYGKHGDSASNSVGGVTGTGGSYSVSPSLPSGLSLNAASGAITGVATAQTAQTKYAVTRNFSGASAADTVTLTVNGFTYPIVSTVYTKGTPVSANTPDFVVGTGGTYSVAPALPAGLSVDSSTGAITGTATVLADTAHYVISRNFAGATASDKVTFAVHDTAPGAITYLANPGHYSLGEGITLNKATVSGGNANLTFTIQSGALPAGISMGPTTGNLFGTPSEVGNFTVTIRASNSGGFAEVVVNLSVQNAEPVVAYPVDTANYTLQSPIADLVPLSTGGAVLSWTIAPDLSAATGLAFNGTTGRITGTPVYATAPTQYIVTATGFGGAQGFDTLVLSTVAAAPTVNYTATPQNWSFGEAITPFAKLGATGIVSAYSVSPSLPAGLALNATTGMISGTPTALSFATDYVITVTGPGGTGKDTVNIAVTTPTPTISYANAPVALNLNVPATPVTKLGATGIVTGYGIAPSLPSGLVFSTITGAISGTPSALSPATDYVITVTGPGGTGKDTVNIAVTTPAPTISYANSPVVFDLNTSVTPIVKLGATGIIGSYGIVPSLPSGLVFSAITGAISGTPSVLSSATDYIVTVTGPGGSGSDTVNIAVTTPAPTISYANGPVVFSLNAAVTPIVKLGKTGIVTSYGIAPVLPAGLAFNTTTGAILGTPTALSPATDYVVTVTGPGGAGADTVNIAVTTPVPTVSYANAPHSFSLNVAITTVAKTGATGIVSGYSIAPSLPSGLVFSTITGAISGTPSALSSATDYIITVTGPGGTGADTVNLSVTTPAPTISYANSPVAFDLNTAGASLVKLGATGIVSGYSIAPSLPSGLVFSTITGAISGTPSALSPATDYTVTVTGPGGTGKDTVSIAVTTPVPTISYANAPVVFDLNAPANPIVKLGKTGIVNSYGIAPALPAGLVFNTTTGAILGNPSALSSATDYVVTVTGPGGTGRDTVNIAVTTPAPTVSYANTPLVFPVGLEIASVSKTGATGIVTGYTVAPTLPVGLALNPTTGRITGTPTVVSAATNYVITVTGPGGTGKDTLSLQVAPNPPVLAFASDTVTFVTGTEIAAFRPSNTGGQITGWSITPGSNGQSLTANTGLVFNPTTGRIQGTPVYVSAARSYSVIASGPGGAADTAVIVIVTKVPLVKRGAGEGEAFAFRVTGSAAGYNLRLPALEGVSGIVSVVIHDMSGRRVWSANVDTRAGIRELAWNGRDNAGHPVSAGMYMVRIAVREEGKAAVTAQGKLTLDR